MTDDGADPPAPATLHPAYFEVRFRVPEPPLAWPEAFAIVTACATTGETWPAARTAMADAALREALLGVAAEVVRVTGFSPTTGHAEPGWAVACGFEQACAIGRAFLQDAIYYVEGDRLSVSHCDERRRRVPVGAFRARIEP